ncbi:MAG: DUF3883 domain-containing protein [Burkholderiaceae bacterium]|nr:DUF3883 domain-containing protein [Burkholderiaceae bacterium]
MMLKEIPKRALKNVGEKIWAAISVMERRYGAHLTHDSGHDKTSNEKATTWIFNFPDFGDAQIAVPMNQEKFSLLMRAKTLDGLALIDLVGDLATVKQIYIDSKGGVASSILGPRAPFLNPSPSNPLLRVVPNSESVEALLALYLARPTRVGSAESMLNPASPGSPESDPSDIGEHPDNTGETKRGRRLVTADELQLQLNRNAETGKAGEMLVVLAELERLRLCDCPAPEEFVERVALSDVGCGYDVASTWPGEERFIEVKSTTRAGSDFFITENECQVLTDLGEKAWLYRVFVGAGGAGEVVARLQDPMNVISPEHRTPVVWRVASEALDDASTSHTTFTPNTARAND